MKIKAISLWQPWASAIVCGWKQIETRHWKTDHRGLLAIHAARNTNGLREYRDMVDQGIPSGVSYFGDDELDDLPRGAIVAVAHLVDVVPTERICDRGTIYGIEFSPAERWYGNYDPERYGWVLQNVAPLAEPVPWKGSQGIFEIEC